MLLPDVEIPTRFSPFPREITEIKGIIIRPSIRLKIVEHRLGSRIPCINLYSVFFTGHVTSFRFCIQFRIIRRAHGAQSGHESRGKRDREREREREREVR